MLLNMTTLSCHFGLLSCARPTPDLRMCEPHCGLPRLGRIDVMISTRASVKALAGVSSLDVDLVWHGPCTDFGPRWFLHARCCPSTLFGKAPDVARRSALMLPLPLRRPRQTLPCPSRASGAFEVRISIFFGHWWEVQLTPARAAAGQAMSERAIRSNWPSDCDLSSATLSLLAVCSPW